MQDDSACFGAVVSRLRCSSQGFESQPQYRRLDRSVQCPKGVGVKRSGGGSLPGSAPHQRGSGGRGRDCGARCRLCAWIYFRRWKRKWERGRGGSRGKIREVKPSPRLFSLSLSLKRQALDFMKGAQFLQPPPSKRCTTGCAAEEGGVCGDVCFFRRTFFEQ